MPTVAQIVTLQDSCISRSACFLFLYGTLHRERRAHLAGLGSSLYASSTQHERLQIPFESRQARHQARDRIYTTSSWLKGQDRFATPAVLGILHSLQVYLLLSSSSMIQGTGVRMLGGGGACAVLVANTCVREMYQCLRCPGS